jgi:DNA-binding NarL/FixJ family response regulator
MLSVKRFTIVMCPTNGMTLSTKILIAEEHFLMAQGLRKLLESEFENVEILENGRDLFSTVASFKPDVILLDGGLLQLNGMEQARYFHNLAAAAKVIIVTGYAQPSHVVEAFRSGVSGYVLKRCTFSELTQAIRQVINGKTYVTRLISQRAIAVAADQVPAKDAASLTPRQREVLQLVAEGCTAKEIANQLNLSVKTAVFHKMAIMDKLGLRTTAELTRYAIENNIVPVKWRQSASAEAAHSLAVAAVS